MALGRHAEPHPLAGRESIDCGTALGHHADQSPRAGTADLHNFGVGAKKMRHRYSASSRCTITMRNITLAKALVKNKGCDIHRYAPKRCQSAAPRCSLPTADHWLTGNGTHPLPLNPSFAKHQHDATPDTPQQHFPSPLRHRSHTTTPRHPVLCFMFYVSSTPPHTLPKNLGVFVPWW